MKKCRKCDGTGKIQVEGFYGYGSLSILESPDTWEEYCDKCDGTGYDKESDPDEDEEC